MATVDSQMKKNIVERPYYTKKIQPHIGKPIIKILTGQRRIGKSYILLQLMDIIRATDESASRDTKMDGEPGLYAVGPGRV